jgi:hypothetical protein
MLLRFIGYKLLSL